MKKFNYYLNGTTYTLEPHGVAYGTISCNTKEQAEGILAHMAAMNPIIEIEDELPDNE